MDYQLIVNLQNNICKVVRLRRDAGGEDFFISYKPSKQEVMKNNYWNKFEAARTHEKFPRIFLKK